MAKPKRSSAHSFKKKRSVASTSKPINKEGYEVVRNKDLHKKNMTPKGSDQSGLTRKAKEIQEWKNRAITKGKRNKKHTSRVSDEIEKHGFVKKPWETEEAFARRFERHTSREIHGEQMKAKFAMAGRDVNEIKKDYEELDESRKRKKEQKRKAYEKRIKVSKKDAPPHDEDDESQFDSEDDDGPDTENKDKEQLHSKKAGKAGKSKRLTKNERIRMYKKDRSQAEEKEMILNAKEVIEFGDRVDAPPKFKGLKKVFDPLFANAGSKNLLLKQILEDNKHEVQVNDNSAAKNKPLKSAKVTEAERQRVVDMYRNMKKAKAKK